MELAKEAMELLSARSNLMNSTLQEGSFFLHSFITSYAVTLSLAPMTTEHPREQKYLTVSAPIPELPPVITAVFPDRFRGTCLYDPPEKYFLRRTRATRNTATEVRQEGVRYYCTHSNMLEMMLKYYRYGYDVINIVNGW